MRKVLVSRFLGFAGTLLLPIDIANSFENTSSSVLEGLWLALYWITFLLTWIIDPLLQVCVCAMLMVVSGVHLHCYLRPIYMYAA